MRTNSNNILGWALSKKSDMKNMEPTPPRPGNTIPDNQMSKKVGTRMWERNVEWFEKTANRPSKWGEIETMYPNNANETSVVGCQK
jgi:hypothetical protein